MERSENRISEEAMHREWGEIQAAQTNPERFRPLYDRYYEAVFRLIYRRTGDEHLCADLCAQVFLKALQKLPAYSFQGVPFSAWLFRIAINEVGQYFRQSQRNQRVVSLEENHLQLLLDDTDEADPEEYQYRRKALLAALDDLKPDDLQLIEMRFFEQRPFKEIAELLDLTENNAKVKVHRLLERLRKKMNPGG
ncbi:MAG: sigma-70 family RNA polymerase sigma factor [Lewinellaceae bacterium]|nr:sigma-70 family RNA polymerase sigma factor [Lewinellaceae bacterium]